MTYRERREARAERLRDWAGKREAKAEAEYKTAHERAAIIPFGQPILVGHYSEGRDRNYRAKIGRGFERSFEHARKAENMASRADNIEAQAAGAIYDDDPDAIERLTEKLAELEAERDAIKAYNRSCRKGAPDASALSGKWAERADGNPLPSYATTNLGGNITRTRNRLARLTSRQERTGTTAKPKRLLALKYAGRCVDCGTELAVGVLAFYDRAERAVTCRACEEGASE